MKCSVISKLQKKIKRFYKIDPFILSTSIYSSLLTLNSGTNTVTWVFQTPPKSVANLSIFKQFLNKSYDAVSQNNFDKFNNEDFDIKYLYDFRYMNVMEKYVSYLCRPKKYANFIKIFMKNMMFYNKIRQYHFLYDNGILKIKALCKKFKNKIKLLKYRGNLFRPCLEILRNNKNHLDKELILKAIFAIENKFVKLKIERYIQERENEPERYDRRY
jgi:hypothetical protein